MKHKLSTADVAGEVACLRQCILGMRVINVYDINPKTYVLKLGRSGEEAEKVFLLIESGVRFHMTQFHRDKNDLPSNITMKLRKHLRGKRVDSVAQLGVDRIVDFSFGSGEAQHHLLLEMYAQGNVILTDSNYSILTLLRQHRDDNNNFAMMPNHPYPVHTIRLYEPITAEQLQTNLKSASEKLNLKSVLAQLLPYGPMLSEHCILKAGLNPGMKPSNEPLTEEQTSKLLTEVRNFEKWLASCQTTAPKGYILLAKSQHNTKSVATAPSAASASDAKATSPTLPDGMIYNDFDPLLLMQKADKQVLDFPTFDAALDEFYSKIEGQRVMQQQAAQEKQAVSRLDKIKTDHQQRVATLQKQAQAAEQCALAIEANVEAVDACIAAVNAQLAMGMDWADLERLISDEKAAGSPMALMVHSLQLDQSQITVILDNWLAYDSDSLSDGDSQDSTQENLPDNTLAAPKANGRKKGPPKIKASVDITVNAYANTRMYYEQKKAHNEKIEKTLASNAKALKQAEAKTSTQITQAAAVANIQQMRKAHWFEKFNWFISSEGYLVLAGRDAQQNELLVKRYMKSEDIYVHAEIHGAATVIVKNHMPGTEVSPISINQAGAACMCRSKAWDSKIVTSAWWVYAHQVSKTAPTGEYLATGSFMVRGKKNYLPPHQLVMGFGFLFRVDEESARNHIGERKVIAGFDDASSIATFHLARTGAASHKLDAARPTNPDATPSVPSGGATLQTKGPLLDANLKPNPPTNNAKASPDQLANADTSGERAHDPSVQYRSAVADNVNSGSLKESQHSEPGCSGELGAEQAQLHFNRGASQLLSEGRGSIDRGAAETDANELACSQDLGHSAEDASSAPAANDALNAFLDGGLGGDNVATMTAKYDRYNLIGADDGAGPAVESNATTPHRAAPKGKRPLSKAERAAMKKGISPAELAAQRARVKEEAEQASKPGAEPKREENGTTTTPQAEQSATHPTNDTHCRSDVQPTALAAHTKAPQQGKAIDSHSKGAQPPPQRGQRSKQKRIAAKYAHQDQEDAELLHMINAAAGPSKSKSDRKAARQARKAAKKDAAQQDDVPNAHLDTEFIADVIVKAKQTLEVSQDLDVPEESDTTSSDEDPATGAADAVDDEIDADDDAGDASHQKQADELAELQALTGQPREDDVLLYAVPVCAPYDVLQKYKYKVKLMPGTQKKGKAARQALELLTRLPEVTPREKTLLHAVGDNESIGAILGNVKISMPGMTKLKKDQKKAKKAGKS